MIAKSECRGGFPFQMKTDRFAEVGHGIVKCAALRDDRNFDALGNVPGLISWSDHRFNGLLQVCHACTVLDFHRGCKANHPARRASSSALNWCRARSM